jgi:hypothetical protein
VPYTFCTKAFLGWEFEGRYASFPFSFQFFTRLAAVFAEEVGGFGIFELDGPI